MAPMLARFASIRWRSALSWCGVGALIFLNGCPPPAVVNRDPRLELRVSDHALGGAAAPVVVIEYGDLECPVCGRFAREVFPTIEREFIQTNRVLWVFRHFPLHEVHAHALRAAAASECAGEQGLFFEYMAVLFDHQEQLEDDDLIRMAGDLGMDGGVFTACLESTRHDERVLSDREDALALGATGTPTFFINGQIARGFFDVESFRALLLAAEAP